MFKSLLDEFASAITGRRVIRLEVTSGLPYEVVQYLESVGVVVWPGQAQILEDCVTCNIQVRESQYNYAAGLLAGLPHVLLIDPKGVKPITPRTSWGKPTRAKGIMAGALRTMAGAMGASAKTPPVKRRK